MAKQNWSSYQTRIFDFVQYERGNAIINAVAGSGKTTTIVEAIRRIEVECPNNIFLAFNKSIAEELTSRNVNAKTFHGLCYGPVTKALSIRQIDSSKTKKIMNKTLTFEKIKMYGSFVEKLVSLAKQIGIGCLVEDQEHVWNSIVLHHDLQLESERASVSEAIAISRNILTLSNSEQSVDFDDLLYLAVKFGIPLPKYDFVFVDEAQDTNAIQRAILKKILNPDARIIAVGDPAQAIYGFRGSDSNSLHQIAREFNCSDLELTISYRCPKSVVSLAQIWMDRIQCSVDAKEGTVQELKSMNVSDIKPGDMIVCRTVKPLISIAYRMMKLKNVAPYIMGRDIGLSLISLIKKMNSTSVDDLQLNLDGWYSREIEKAMTTEQESKIQGIEDKYDSICYLIDDLDKANRSIDSLISVINTLFEDKQNSATLCTIHKAKGLEADRVIWVNYRKMPSKWARLQWQQEQERNLCYVAATRSKDTLLLVEEENVK